MGIENEAKIKLTLEGAEDTANKADKAKQAFTQVGQTFKSVDGALAEMGANLQRLVNNFSNAATGMKAIDFGTAKERAKSFEETVDRMSLRVASGLGDLESQSKDLGQALGIMPERILSAAESFTDLTADAQGSMMAIAAIGEKADRTGTQIEKLIPLAVTMKTAFGTSAEEMVEGLERVRQVSASLGTAGGERGFQDMIVSLGPQLQKLGIHSQEARDKMLAFLGVMTQGYSKEQAKAVGGELLGGLDSMNPLMLMRTLQENPYDKQGNLKDPVEVYKKLREKTVKRLGKDGAYKAFLNSFGAKRGSVLFYGNYEQVDELSQQMKGARDTGGVPLGDRPGATPEEIAENQKQRGFELQGRRTPEEQAQDQRMIESMKKDPRFRGLLRDFDLSEPEGYAQGRSGQRNTRDVEKGNTELTVGGVTAESEDRYQSTFQGHRGIQMAVETGVSILPESWQSGAKGAAAGLSTVYNLQHGPPPAPELREITKAISRLPSAKEIGAEVKTANQGLKIYALPPPLSSGTILLNENNKQPGDINVSPGT